MGVFSYLERKKLHHWGADYARHWLTRRAPRLTTTRHVLFAICDHWEPLFGGVDDAHADRRVRAWTEGYPKLASRFTDADGRHPQHSFFFPGEHYRPRWLDDLANLCRRGFGEVELHLHHDGDNEESLRQDLELHVQQLASHGHFSRPGGRPAFAFIHGNWCLSNSRADGRYCGVDAEMPLLFELGCYADFTFPAPESDAQPKHVNQIMWPVGNLARRRAYEDAERARVGHSHQDRLLFIQGPSGLFYRGGKSPVSIEGSALTADNPATSARVKLWGDLGISVSGRPEWQFVKMHTHGAPDAQAESLLGEPGAHMHELLQAEYNTADCQLHYVTAREMFNVARAAMDGKSGNPNDYRDYLLPPPPARG